MPRPFSLTMLGILLEPILDPLGRSDVSIGQSPSDLLCAMQKLSVGMPFRDQEGGDAQARVIPASVWRVEPSTGMVLRGWELNLGYHSSIPRNFGGLQVSWQI